MSVTALHKDKNEKETPILATTAGERAIFFTADLDVNTDGASRSYHPADPRGQSLALNNIANAITRMFDAQGNDITCWPRSGACFDLFIKTFERARDAGYNPLGHSTFRTTGIIPWQLDEKVGRKVPCTIKEEPFAGYFVSQTAVIANKNAGICDQHRYLDALAINAVVLPLGAEWKSQGTTTDGGDLVAVLDSETKRLAFALVGDRGPRDSIGEGTVALAAELGGNTVEEGATFRQMKELKRTKVHYLIFPSRDVPRLTNGHFTQTDIDRLGTDALAAFGGRDRLEDCASE